MGRNAIVLVDSEKLLSKILVIRGIRVMLDSDLAGLYGVRTKQLKRQVRRNLKRFPGDFMFQLTEEECNILRRQNGTPSWGGIRYLPYAFTEQGVAMLSSVLNSERAVQVNIHIMRAFVKTKEYLPGHKEITGKINELERKVTIHDDNMRNIFISLRYLTLNLPRKKRT